MARVRKRTNIADERGFAPSFEEPLRTPFDADVVVDAKGVLLWRCSGEHRKCCPRSHRRTRTARRGKRAAAP